MPNTDNNIAYLYQNNQDSACCQSSGNLALQEEILYHNPASKGFVSFLIKNENGSKKKWRRNSCYVSEIDNFRAKIPETADIYITQSEFKKPCSKTIHFKSTQVSFIDIDIYKSEAFRDVYHNHVKYAILDYCEIEGIPKPSLIINSGRGFYLKWLYKKPIPYPALPRWKAMQRHLWGIFEEFGADRKALDASRVLRVVGTVNSKNNKMCTIAWKNIDEAGELVRYDFDTVFDQIMPLTREKLKKLREEKAERLRAINLASK